MSIRKRLLLDLLLFIGIFVLPWWLVLIAALAVAIFTRSYYELAVLGFFFDLLYGIPGEKFLGVPYFFTWFTLVVFVVLEYFGRERLRINA